MSVKASFPTIKTKIKTVDRPIITSKIARQLNTPKAGRSGILVLDIRAMLKKIIPEDDYVEDLMKLTYKNRTELILTVNNVQIFKEVYAMLLKQGFELTYFFLREAPNANHIMWEQKIMDEGKIALEKEITIQRYEEVGVKGIGRCKYCTSTELIFVQKQINSGDEPMKVFVRCVACQNHWRM